MPLLTLVPVTPITGGRAICDAAELCSDTLLCGSFGVSMVAAPTTATLTLTPVVAA